MDWNVETKPLSKMAVRMAKYRRELHLTTDAAADIACIPADTWAKVEHGWCCRLRDADNLATLFQMPHVDAYDEILRSAETGALL